MKKWLIFTLLSILFAVVGCSKFEPGISQNITRLEVFSPYEPMEVISITDGEDYDIQILENNINPDKLGSYHISYEITQGKRSITMDFPVQVVDTTKPEIVLTTPYEIETGSSFDEQFLPEEHFQVTDNYDGDLLSKLQYEGEVDTSSAGTREIKVSVTDSSSNTSTITVNVSVVGRLTEDAKREGTTYHAENDSSLTLNPDETFTFVVNTCDGTKEYTGAYQEDEDTITLYLTQPLLDSDPASGVLTLKKKGESLIYSSSYELCAPKKSMEYKP